MTESIWWWGVFFKEEEKAANVPDRFIEEFKQLYENSGCPKGMCLVLDTQNQYLMLPMQTTTFYTKLKNKGYDVERRMQKIHLTAKDVAFVAGDETAISNL